MYRCPKCDKPHSQVPMWCQGCDDSLLLCTAADVLSKGQYAFSRPSDYEDVPPCEGENVREAEHRLRVHPRDRVIGNTVSTIRKAKIAVPEGRFGRSPPPRA